MNKDISLSAHLSKAAKARWAKTTPAERSAYARKVSAARMTKMTPEQRSDHARNMVAAREAKRKAGKTGQKNKS